MTCCNRELQNWDSINVNTLEMVASGAMEINNVDEAIEDICQHISRLCHTSIFDPPKELILDSFAHHGGTKWKLDASGCLNFQNRFIHLEVILRPSEDGKVCNLTVALKSCQENSHVEFSLKEIKEAFITLDFLNDRFKIVENKYVHIPGPYMTEDQEIEPLSSTDEQFCTKEALHKFLQLSPKGCVRQCSYKPIPIEYEFVLLQVTLHLCLYPQHDNYKYLNPTICSGAEQLQLSMEIPSQIWGTSKIRRTVTFSETTNNSKAEKASVFPELVTIKCGTSLEHSLQVHKHLLIEKSSVFEVMLSSGMMEAQTGEIRMPEVSLEVMDTFVTLVYGMDIRNKLRVQVLVGVLELIHLYQMEELLDPPVRMLMFNTNGSRSVGDVKLIYDCGYKLNIPDLQQHALKWFKENRKNMSASEQELLLIELLSR